MKLWLALLCTLMAITNSGRAALQITLDYSEDSINWATPERRKTLEDTARYIEGFFTYASDEAVTVSISGVKRYWLSPFTSSGFSTLANGQRVTSISIGFNTEVDWYADQDLTSFEKVPVPTDANIFILYLDLGTIFQENVLQMLARTRPTFQSLLGPVNSQNYSEFLGSTVKRMGGVYIDRATLLFALTPVTPMSPVVEPYDAGKLQIPALGQGNINTSDKKNRCRITALDIAFLKDVGFQMEPLPTLTLQVGGPFVFDGHPKTASATLSNGDPVTLTYNGVSTAPTKVGSYIVIANGSGQSAQGTLVIAQAPIALRLTGSKTYDGSNEATNLTLSVDGKFVPEHSISFSAAPLASASPGTYSVVFTPFIEGGKENYAVTLSSTYTIEPATLTLSTPSNSRLVGAANPALPITITGLIGKDKWKTRPKASTTATTKSPEGLYPITIGYNEEPWLKNYVLAIPPAFLRVVDAVGIYEAAIERFDRPIGRLTLTVSKSKSFTAQLRHGALTKDLSARGALSLDIEGNGLASLTMGGFPLQLRLKQGVLTGTYVSDSFTGLRRAPTSIAGVFTGTLEPTTAGNPAAAGGFSLSVSNKAVLTYRGYLGDGRPFTASANGDLAGLAPVFTRPFGNRSMAFLSGLTVVGENQIITEAEGEPITWRVSKPAAATDTSVPLGYDLDYITPGSAWNKNRLNGNYILNATPHSTTLDTELTKTLGFLNGNLVKTPGWSMSFTADGRFTGRFIWKSGTIKRIASITGVIINDSQSSYAKATYGLSDIGNKELKTGEFILFPTGLPISE